MSAKKVLVLGSEWLPGVLGRSCDLGEPRGFACCVEAFRESREHGILARFLSESRENRIIYLGDDGVLARVFGDRVLDLYGSRTRLRCRNCGHRWWIGESQRCPVCGSVSYEPDYTPPGERPRQRRLSEALYEVTSSDEAYFAGLGDPPETVELLLLLVATKFAKKIAIIGTGPRVLEADIPVVEDLESILY